MAGRRKKLWTEAAEIAAGARSAGERRKAMMRFAGDHGISERTAWRWAAGGGWTSGRKERSDKGTSSVPEEAALLAAKISADSAKDTGEPFLRPAWLVVEDLRLNGILDHSVSPSTLLRARAGLALSPDEMIEARDRPRHVRLKSEHPNHVHQVDATHCIKLFASPRGVVYRDIRKKVYHNKPAAVRAVYNVERTIWRYAVVDHYSGSFRVIYREEPGESSAGYFEALLAAWRTKEKMLFHGVPRILVADRGSAILAQSSPVRRVVESLGIIAIAHAAGNPRAKGAVEGLMRHWERWFESGLAQDPARDVAELNARAEKFCTHVNRSRPFRRSGALRRDLSRERRWSAIRSVELHELPENEDLLRDLLTYSPEPRRIGRDGYFNFVLRGTSGIWKVADSEVWGRRGIVTVNPYRLSETREIDIAVDDIRHAAVEITVDRADFVADAVAIGSEHRRPEDGRTETAMKSALAAEVPEDFRSFVGEGARGPEVAALPRRGREIEMPRAAPRRINRVEACLTVFRAIQEQFGRGAVTQDDRDALKARWPEFETVDEADIPAALEERLAQRVEETEAREA